MSNDQQQPFEDVVENSNTNQVLPESNESSPQDNGTTTRDMYDQACRDINGLPILGRIVLALAILFVLWKATPVLDLLWIFIQLFVIPCTLLISLGLLSHSSYMLVIGWMNESLVWVRNRKDDIVATQRES